MAQVDLDTGIDESDLIARQVIDDASFAASTLRQGFEAAEWLDEIRHEFHRAMGEGRPDYAVALAHGAMLYAYVPDVQFDLLNLQGIGLGAMIAAGGPVELYDFRVAAFEKAMLALPEDRSWTHADMLCRLRLAAAWREYGIIKQDTDMLTGARDEYAALLPALREGRWGYAMHAKTAEVAALLARTVEEIAKIGAPNDPWPDGMRVPAIDPDPLPHWLLALELALDPKLRTFDTLGYWDAAMEPLEEWLDQLRYKPEAKEAGAAVCKTLQALKLPSGNPDHGWVQYYMGVFATVAGLQADGLRTEAKSDGDADKLASAVSAYRKALAEIEAGNGGYWPSTAFQLAYAIHALGEARSDIVALNEAIGLYEQVILRLADCIDQEDSLLQAQTQVNLSEAMAQIAEITDNGTLARHAMNIAADAEMGFTFWAHDEGIEVAQANIARITGVIDAIEQP